MHFRGMFTKVPPVKVTLEEIRQRTYKPRDAWWTVLLVDPIAARLVRLVAPYRRITPNVLTVIATIIGLGSAACFAMQSRWWLVAGALLFHVSFIVDCMDGKIARLNGTGSMFGTWLDFMFDRVRVFICALALFGGQYVLAGPAQALVVGVPLAGAACGAGAAYYYRVPHVRAAHPHLGATVGA